MVTQKLRQIEMYRNRIARLEVGLQKERRKLLALPAKLGFKTVDALIAALKAAKGESPSSGAVAKRRKRAKITSATKASVKQLVGQKKTGLEIASTLGISLPSVQNIKRELGLVKRRK